jgi:hypothetical protein
MANLNLKSITAVARTSLTKFPGITVKPPVAVPVPIIPITPLGENSVVPGSRRTRPLWFNGRFLAAQDLQRDQNYFLQNQATLGRAAGYGVVHGLTVEQAINGGEPDAETIIISAGQGLTPGGDLVMLSTNLTVRLSDLAEELDLDVQFGLSESPDPIARTRTGIYVIALRPVQFTANPITSYPTDVQGARATQDGSVIEATAVSLVPYPLPAADFDSSSQKAAAARQVFVENNSGMLSQSLLPLAMISVERGTIQWVDEWMVRRESGPEFNGLRLALAEIAAQQAYVRQYDAQLQQIVQPMVDAKSPANFPATSYFQALPPAGRFPLASIDGLNLTQVFFPPQTNVTLSVVPEDELATLINESMSLEPIDLTLPASSYADLAVLMLLSVPRRDFAKFSSALPAVELSNATPLAFSVQSPLELLRFFRGKPAQSPPPGGGLTWPVALQLQTYGYFVRRRSVPKFTSFTLTATTTTISVSPVAGSQATQYTATVTPSAATGTVLFTDGSTALGTADIHAGVATLVLPALSATGHKFVALYHGDTNYASSSSPALET